MRIELVEWLDHCSTNDDSWKTIRDLSNTPIKILTVGVVVKEDDVAITMVSTIYKDSVSSITEEDQCGGIMTIIKSCIVRRKVLR